MNIFSRHPPPHPHDDARYPVRRSDDEWRARLDGVQYQIGRHGATERAFTGAYWDHWSNGEYRCVGCDALLFRSQAKFDAGCGWPSYSEPAQAGAVERVRDEGHGMSRVEVRCSRCGTHLGHVFSDGPEPTGERYCINSAVIAFRPSE